MRRRRCLLLSGTALSLGAAFSLAEPPAALAACVDAGTNPVVITCDDTTTRNDDNPPIEDIARNQIFDDDIEAEVQLDATVDGYGLRIETTLADGEIVMNHFGDAVILDVEHEDADTLGGAFGPGALELNGNGGLVDYTGTGDIHNLTTMGAGLLVTNSGEIQIHHSLGTILAPGIGIYAASTGATSDVTVTAGGIVQGGDGSIRVSASGTGDASIMLLDGATLEGGVLALSDLGNASITAGNGVTVIGNSPGAASITAGGDATQAWGDNAFVSGSSGIVVDQTSPGGLGDAIVVVGADGEIIGDGTDAADDYNGNGIFAGNQGIGLTSVTTGAGTSVTGEANGIVAFQTDPQSVSTMTIVTDGPVTGNGTDGFSLPPYTDAFDGATMPTTGLGIGVSNEGTGGIIVTAGGTVLGADTGIQILAARGGNITVTTDATVEGTTGFGILTLAQGGDITVTANDGVTGATDGIQAVAGGTGNILVTTGGIVEGTASNGIQTVTSNGDITITADDDVTGGINGVVALAGGTGTIVVTTNGAVEGAAFYGIGTITANGNTTITANGDVTGGTDGILADVGGAGNIVVTTNGAVEGTALTGITTTTDNGNITITANDGVTGGMDGILATAGGAGNIVVTTAGAVEGTDGDGITTTAVNGDTTITANSVTGDEDGIDAEATGTGAVSITTTGGTITAVGDGLKGQTTTGAVTIVADGAVEAGNDGIHARTTTGNIDISGSGDIAGDDNGGAVGDGINAASSGGNVVVDVTGAVTGASGIALSTTLGGEIELTTGGAVEGAEGDGINTSAVNGITTITANADVTGAGDGIDAAATGTGDIDIEVAAGADVTGTAGSGVTTTTATGTATIDNAGLIQGAFAAISGATSTVLDVVNQAGGLIQNLSADIGDLAISVTGTGATDIDNDGTVRGRISLDAGDDTLTNSGTWATTGVSDFGAGNNTIVNSGLLVAAEDPLAAENTHLANINSFTNTSTGTITLVDDNAPNVHDTLTIDGTYIGEPGSAVMLDLALVAGDPQAGTDVLILDPANPATGTSDLLFNIVSTGVTATTTDTGRVGFIGGQFLNTPVTVVENRGTLVTSSGDDDIPLARSGFINYDLVSTGPAGGDYQVVSSLDSGLAGGVLLPIHATLAAVAFTTQRTPNPITATCIDPDNKPNAQGGWARVFGADFQTDTSGTARTNGTVGELESENRTRFATLQGGLDHVLCNLDGNGGNLHLGVTVGHTFGSSRQTDPDPLAGIFGTDIEFDSFFIGPYAAYTRGDLAIQASMRFDHHSLELTNPTAGLDADGIDFDASAVSGTAAVSYDFEVREDLTVTPEIGINVSKTEIDKFDIAGGTVILDDLWSAIGHVGVTARTTIPVIDNLFVIPFASATLYHEFIESADAQLIIGPTTTDVESNRVGTFGQLGIGANAVRLGDVVAGRPTLFGGARFDLQVGERIEGATATVFGRVQF